MDSAFARAGRSRRRRTEIFGGLTLAQLARQQSHLLEGVPGLKTLVKTMAHIQTGFQRLQFT
jgi:hypothetical protein